MRIEDIPPRRVGERMSGDANDPRPFEDMNTWAVRLKLVRPGQKIEDIDFKSRMDLIMIFHGCMSGDRQIIQALYRTLNSSFRDRAAMVYRFLMGGGRA